jgi:hypothetical protein
MRTLALLIAVSVVCLAADYYVAPNGSPTAAGTISDPWSLSKICTGSANPPPIQAGDTIWMRGGEYIINAPISCRFVGTASQRIALRAVPGERPVIVVDFSYNEFCAAFDNSQYFDLWGIWWVYKRSRIEPIGGSNPVGNAVPSGIKIPYGVYNRSINNVTLGPGDSVGWAHGADRGLLIYGHISHTDGGDAPDRGHGAVAYQQNYDSMGEPEYVENVIALPGYRTSPAWQVTASQAVYVQRIRIKNIISAVSVGIGSYGGCSVSMREMYLQDSLLRYAPSLPYGCNTARDAVVTGNLMATSYSNPRASGGTYSNNWAVGGFSVTTCSTLPEGGSCTAPTVSNNQASTPASNWVVVYPNAFEEGRAHIGIYNWTNAATQQIDMSSVWDVGQYYEVIDAWNMVGPPVWSGRYEGGSITLPLDGRAGTYQPEGRTDACWHVGRETCCTSGDYVCAATVAELPTNVPLYQPGITTSNWRIYYWGGSSWVDGGYNMPTQRNKPDLGRGDGKLHAFVARRAFRTAQRTTVHWAGTTADTVEYQAEGRWFPGVNKQCSGSVCSAEILGYGGYGTWRINGGSPMVAFLR